MQNPCLLDSFEEEKAPDALYESREAEFHYSDKQPHVSVIYFSLALRVHCWLESTVHGGHSGTRGDGGSMVT